MAEKTVKTVKVEKNNGKEESTDSSKKTDGTFLSRKTRVLPMKYDRSAACGIINGEREGKRRVQSAKTNSRTKNELF